MEVLSQDNDSTGFTKARSRRASTLLPPFNSDNQRRQIYRQPTEPSLMRLLRPSMSLHKRADRTKRQTDQNVWSCQDSLRRHDPARSNDLPQPTVEKFRELDQENDIAMFTCAHFKSKFSSWLIITHFRYLLR